MGARGEVVVEKDHLNFKSFANFSMEENGKTNKRFHYEVSPSLSSVSSGLL